GYLFLPSAWGFGYATEACGAALDWLAGALPCESAVLATQTADVGSMRLAAKLGFTEVERFRAWDAEQWLGMRSPVVPSRTGQARPRGRRERSTTCVARPSDWRSPPLPCSPRGGAGRCSPHPVVLGDVAQRRGDLVPHQATFVLP